MGAGGGSFWDENRTAGFGEEKKNDELAGGSGYVPSFGRREEPRGRRREKEKGVDMFTGLENLEGAIDGAQGAGQKFGGGGVFGGEEGGNERKQQQPQKPLQELGYAGLGGNKLGGLGSRQPKEMADDLELENLEI